MPALNPYLIFDGNCLEAIQYYRDTLGATIKNYMHFEEGPMNVPDSEKKRIMHAVLDMHGSELMASDNMPDQTTTQGENVVLSLTFDDLEQTESYYNSLVAEGKSIMPFEKTFWGSHFGYVQDKFGIYWMISCDQNPEQ